MCLDMFWPQRSRKPTVGGSLGPPPGPQPWALTLPTPPAWACAAGPRDGALRRPLPAPGGPCPAGCQAGDCWLLTRDAVSRVPPSPPPLGNLVVALCLPAAPWQTWLPPPQPRLPTSSHQPQAEPELRRPGPGPGLEPRGQVWPGTGLQAALLLAAPRPTERLGTGVGASAAGGGDARVGP